MTERLEIEAFGAFDPGDKTGERCACLPHASESGYSTHIASLDFAPRNSSKAFLVTRRRASSPSSGAQKNGVRRLRSGASGLVRPQAAPRARSALRRHADLPRFRSASRALPELRRGEARAARLAGRQPALHQALRHLRGAALPGILDQGRRPRTAPGLEDGQGPREAVHARATRAGPARPAPKVIGIDEISIRKGHTYRIVVSDLVRRRPIWFGGTRSLGSEHGRVLRVAGREEEPTHPAGGHGHVEAVSQLHASAARPAGRDPVRQVPRPASPGRGAR